MMEKGITTYDAIVIGSGLSGLLCSNILAREGMRVCVIEQHHQPGGCLQTFTRKGIRFDTGVHYVGGLDPGQPLYRYWNYFGLTKSVEFMRMDPDGFDLIGFRDREYPIAMGFENFIERLLPYFPDRKESLKHYVDSLNRIAQSFPLYNLEIPGNHDEHIFKNQSAAGFFNSFQQPLSSVLGGNNLLYAGNAETTPLYIPAIINHSFISSAWRPVNGSNRIASALVEKLESMGGELFLKQRISEIRYRDQMFTCNSSTGMHYSAPRLISSIHPAVTLGMMDPSLFRKPYLNRISGLNNTIGSFTIHAVLKSGSFPSLHHNYYHHATEDVWTTGPGKQWPSGYMLQTPLPDSANGFAKSLVVMASMPFEWVNKWENTTTGQRGSSYAEFKEKAADTLLKMAEQRYPWIRQAIDSMEVSTPLTWRDFTGTPEGSMYGIEHDYRNALVSSVLPATKVPGLYFTGQNINLHGVLGVTIGSILTCSEIFGVEYLLNKIRNHE